MKYFTNVASIIKILAILSLLLSISVRSAETVQRFGKLRIIQPIEVEIYEKHYKSLGSKILEELKTSNIHRYSVYLKYLDVSKPCLFSYFEYTGDNISTDLAKLRESPVIKKWKSKGHKEYLSYFLSDPGKWYDMEQVFYFAGKKDFTVPESKVRRHGFVIGLRPDMVDSYTLLHKHAWPEVLDAIKKGSIRNYSIYLQKFDDKYYLFTYFEYIGDNYTEDMKMIDSDPSSVAWMKFTDKYCQIPLPTRAQGEWWAEMGEIFHCCD